MSYEIYTSIISVTCGISFYVGFYIGNKIKSKAATYILILLVLVVDGFLIYNYLTNYYQQHEGVCYLVFVLSSFLQVTNGCAVIFYIKRANQIVKSEEQEILGSMIFDVIVAAGCLATVIAAFLPTIKLVLNQGLSAI